ncbi:hypothetical protein V202x_29780 [Gimesia aquarii]|uniref:Uncharacterized protein n=1 Tax=Gimesia aquarii TaxID=2527964 RepID=A0A517WWF5_9PLAN|nr:hypothetical protein V202x_29780 [Gimesia aquarii]
MVMSLRERSSKSIRVNERNQHNVCTQSGVETSMFAKLYEQVNILNCFISARSWNQWFR